MPPVTFTNLKSNFHRFLEYYQPDIPRLKNNFSINLIKSDDMEQKLLTLFATDSFLNDKNNKLSQVNPLKIN